MVQRLCLYSLYRFCIPSENGVSHTGTPSLCQRLDFSLYFTSRIFVLRHIIDKKGLSESKAARLSEFSPGAVVYYPLDGYAPLQPSGYYMCHHV